MAAEIFNAALIAILIVFVGLGAGFLLLKVQGGEE